MDPNSPMQDPTLPSATFTPSNGFRCPYRYGCWQREAVRIALAAIVAVAAALSTRCTLSVRAPGLSLESSPSWPTTAAAPTPEPRP